MWNNYSIRVSTKKWSDISE
uniref:Uncharacterized protein n=1 Tax=Anguilla anguilla TaxID=7936 RepID=A0A0E9U099_ANGAN